MNILLTGANGLVGRSTYKEATQRGFAIKRAIRTSDASAGNDAVVIGNIDAQTAWQIALRGVDVVIHLAARVHVMHEAAHDPLAAFRAVNVEGTANLARQAAQAGVKRLVYVSSIKVNGESTPARQAFSENEVPHPQDAYAASKREAEQALHHVAAETGLEIVIVRPPLVYGPGVKGNFAQMMHVLERGIPLPLALVRNQRSLISVGILADALLACATHPAAAGQTFLVSAGEDISTRPSEIHWLVDSAAVQPPWAGS
jgi:nucleoside-diphosphate-sugar epimerase